MRSRQGYSQLIKHIYCKLEEWENELSQFKGLTIDSEQTFI